MALLLSVMLLTGCSSWTKPVSVSGDADPPLTTLRGVELLLLGERHDAPEHPGLQRQVVQALSARGTLAAVALEMAEAGTSSAGLPIDASEAQVRAALRWHDAAWPWTRYGPVVMAAVQAGVPVAGANLPREQLRAAMQDATLDERLPPAEFARQQQQIRYAHCGLLPAAQILPMTRVQIARDRAMADTLARLRQPGRTVLLIAGGHHVRRDLGVPTQLPAGTSLQVVQALPGPRAETDREGLAADDLLWPTPALPERDACAELRRGWPAPR